MKKIFGFILVILIFSNCVLTAQWVQTNGPNSKTFCLTVKGKNLFAGTDSGVCLSTNNGTNWKTLNNGLNFYYYEYGYNFPPQRSTFHTIAYLDTNLFVGSWGCGVFLSTNNGTSWSAVNDGLADLDGKAFVTSLVVPKVMQTAQIFLPELLEVFIFLPTTEQIGLDLVIMYLSLL